MKKTSLQQYENGTAEYVVMHARFQASRGRKSSISWLGRRNPKQALEYAKLFAYFPPTINLHEAKKVAGIFRRLNTIQSVEVFGSVARGQEGSDLDLILVCDDETSHTFMELVEFEARVSKRLKAGRYHGYASTRSNIAEQILVTDIASKDNPFDEALMKCKVGIDIFMFPPNWRDRLSELQSRMGHDDPEFMKKIAKDARRIA